MIKLIVKSKYTENKSAKLDLTCPKCKRSGKYLLSKLQKERRFKCVGCGDTVTITGGGLDAIKRFADELKKARVTGSTYKSLTTHSTVAHWRRQFLTLLQPLFLLG